MKTITVAEFKKLRKGKPRFPRAPKCDRTADGIVFDSRAEMGRYCELRALRIAGEVEWFIRQPILDLGGGTVYRPDFLVQPVQGDLHAQEVKGTFSGRFRAEALRTFRRNKKQAEALYPFQVVLVER